MIIIIKTIIIIIIIIDLWLLLWSAHGHRGHCHAYINLSKLRDFIVHCSCSESLHNTK